MLSIRSGNLGGGRVRYGRDLLTRERVWPKKCFMNFCFSALVRHSDVLQKYTVYLDITKKKTLI